MLQRYALSCALTCAHPRGVCVDARFRTAPELPGRFYLCILDSINEYDLSINMSRSINLSTAIYIYIYIYILFSYIYIYIYILIL